MNQRQALAQARKRWGSRAHIDRKRLGKQNPLRSHAGPDGYLRSVGVIKELLPGLPMFEVFGWGPNWQAAFDHVDGLHRG